SSSCGGCSCCYRRGRRRRRRRSRCRGRRTRSASQIERADSQLPPTYASRGDVLIYVPESGVVGWIDVHRRIVAPAVESGGLRAGPILYRSFAEGHLAGRIAIVAGGVKHARKRRGWVAITG